MPPLTVGATLRLRELLTDGFFRLAQDLHSGQYDAAQLAPLWHMPTETFDPVQTLLALQQPSRTPLTASHQPSPPDTL